MLEPAKQRRVNGPGTRLPLNIRILQERIVFIQLAQDGIQGLAGYIDERTRLLRGIAGRGVTQVADVNTREDTNAKKQRTIYQSASPTPAMPSICLSHLIIRIARHTSPIVISDRLQESRGVPESLGPPTIRINFFHMLRPNEDRHPVTPRCFRAREFVLVLLERRLDRGINSCRLRSTEQHGDGSPTRDCSS